jgi:hypothetical protein
MATQAAARKGPVTPDERERIIASIRAGKGCNEIAAEVGRGPATISRIATAEGLSFDRSQTRAATEARQADMQARLTDLSEQLLTDVERLRRQLWKPCLVYDFGGKENTYAEHELPEPDFRAKQAIFTSIGIAVDKVIAIRKQDTGGGEAIGLIVQLVDGIKREVDDA